MKIKVTTLAMALLAAACNQNPKEVETAKVDSVKILRDSLALDSFKRAEAEKKELEEQKTQTVQESAVATQQAVETQSNVAATTAEAPASEKKKGWSAAAKGAAIGGAAGVATGIIVDKNNVRGAVVGGAVGAGAGYLIGRDKDKKSGRVQK